ncbi:ester cyclase [Beijerinckia sp. L45]|uniref:ester cyclase n=1 Tax=Beijerinckia sp. L45 TaxID=1641855 RepID=UPI00131DBEBF|nr:ester cyclase [Beijerinckia sp. L45]
MTSTVFAWSLVAAALLPGKTVAQAADVGIANLVIASGVPTAQRDADLGSVRAFYYFWDTGNEDGLKTALATGFVDHTLPEGRPQGPKGPAFASRMFRAAVPDLRVAIEKMIVAGDYVTVHMRFTGHFRGTMGAVKGAGQPVDFIATDLLKITDGRITDNWHIEDNLTLFKQMGIAKLAM